MSQTYRVLKDSALCQDAKAGTVVFKQTMYDYGLAADDTAITGIEHISVSLKRHGGYPGFTIPLRDLEPTTVEPLPNLTDEHVNGVCRPGTEEACRYLTAGSKGWSCEKHTPLGDTIDERVAAGTFRAKGDNCEGRGP